MSRKNNNTPNAELHCYPLSTLVLTPLTKTRHMSCKSKSQHGAECDAHTHRMWPQCAFLQKVTTSINTAHVMLAAPVILKLVGNHAKPDSSLCDDMTSSVIVGGAGMQSRKASQLTA